MNVSSGDLEQHLADLVVGARGWLHEQWIDDYYPEDIPDEWRLGFYANEFNTLLVPWAQWKESVAALEEGLEDTEDDFHLYLELPDTLQPFPAHLEQILERVTGFVMLSGEAANWQQQADELGKALFVGLPQNKTIFQSYSVLGTDKPVELVLIDSTDGITDLTVMREQLELALALADSRLDLIFTDTPPTLEAMRNTQMIAELLGA